ncbi:MAG: PEP-CTERM sorting domain-containing protein [Akkermansiaceae bacterium]
MKIQKILTTTLLTGFLAAGSAQAAVLVTYELTGGSAIGTDANGADSITFSNLVFNGFDQSDVTSDTVPGDQDLIQVLGSEDVGGSNDLNTNLGQAVAANSYFSFTVANNSGLALQLDSFSVDTAYTNSYRAGYGLFSSADGFDSIGADLIASRATTPTTFNSFTEVSTTQQTDLLTLAGAGANVASTDFLLADGEALTFFLVGTQNSSSVTRAWEFDNISISGTTIPVPEPSSTALLGLGGLALILRRRK